MVIPKLEKCTGTRGEDYEIRVRRGGESVYETL